MQVLSELASRYEFLRGKSDAGEEVDVLEVESLRSSLLPECRESTLMVTGLKQLLEEQADAPMDEFSALSRELSASFDAASFATSRLVVLDQLATEDDEEKRKSLWSKTLAPVYDSLAPEFSRLMLLSSTAPHESLRANLRAIGVELDQLEKWFKQGRSKFELCCLLRLDKTDFVRVRRCDS
jgi:hypothetical protein